MFLSEQDPTHNTWVVLVIGCGGGFVGGVVDHAGGGAQKLQQGHAISTTKISEFYLNIF